jgi:hypothetical protein
MAKAKSLKSKLARIAELETELAYFAAEHTRVHWELTLARADNEVTAEQQETARLIIEAGRRRRGEIH